MNPGNRDGDIAGELGPRLCHDLGLRRPHGDVSQEEASGSRGCGCLPRAFSGQVHILDVVVAAFFEGRLAQEEIRVAGCILKSLARVGVS